ncbi:MAG TPA: enolase C-terminal domain-like protein [Bryobacteraceae bacterium]|nr:enolase C-terminal domain-like protein [Bryobacteraceae bacterium]
MGRRKFLAAAMAAPGTTLRARGRDIRIETVAVSYENYRYRRPMKFGGNIVDRVTVANVRATVRDGAGRVAHGFGSMPLGNVWSFPSRKLGYDATLAAMQALAARIEKITGGYREAGHPVELNLALEPAYFEAAAAVSRERGLAEPIPKLATLVTASPFDAALHDAYGKLHGVNCFRTYGREFLARDLGELLARDFRGESLDRYVLGKAKPSMPLYHLVGAVDPLTDADVKERVPDGLPETLPEWIVYNGVTHIKIKLNGDDLAWDSGRVLAVDRVSAETQRKRGVARWVYSLDFNERCPNVAYLLDFLHRVKEGSPEAYERIQYVEQPTARDLEAHRSNTMHEAAKLKPVVIDESLTGLDRLLLAREMGYTGVALKACKGQTQALLMAAAAQKYRMFLCVQDLTCPGASLIHSASLAAHVPGVAAIEANARQYVPEANRGWEKKFPGIFVIKDGMMKTAELDGRGLGAVEES